MQTTWVPHSITTDQTQQSTGSLVYAASNSVGPQFTQQGPIKMASILQMIFSNFVEQKLFFSLNSVC